MGLGGINLNDMYKESSINAWHICIAKCSMHVRFHYYYYYYYFEK